MLSDLLDFPALRERLVQVEGEMREKDYKVLFRVARGFEGLISMRRPGEEQE